MTDQGLQLLAQIGKRHPIDLGQLRRGYRGLVLEAVQYHQCMGGPLDAFR